MTRDQLERMTFRALERVRNLEGDVWMSVFDGEMSDWFEWYWQVMDADERAECESHRQFLETFKRAKPKETP